MPTATKFSEDIVPLSDLKVNPGRFVNRIDMTHRPVLLTNRGRGVTVLQSLRDYETDAEERAFMKAVVQVFADIEEGRTVSLADAIWYAYQQVSGVGKRLVQELVSRAEQLADFPDVP